MIKLTKGPRPDVLVRKAEEWSVDLQAAIDSGNKKEIRSKKSRYNHPDIKFALKRETREKCAYCEAKVTDVAHGDIEHVTPKSTDISKTFVWENLTFSCQICNQNKSNKDGVIDPYQTSPAEHLMYLGAFIKGLTLTGSLSVRELQLNRPALLEGRNREIERYANELEKAKLVSDDRLRDLIVGELKKELHSQRPEFSAVCSAALQPHW